MLAQQALTLDHVTRGRSILGLGSGEQLNVTPYGMDFDKPVGHLDEGIDVIRLLWEADGAVDFEGEFYTLRDAVLGLLALHPGRAADLDRGPRAADARAHRPQGRRLAADEDGARASTPTRSRRSAGRPWRPAVPRTR